MSEQCKYDLVPFGGRPVNFRRCENNAKRDGFCMTHHPDRVKLRRLKSEQLWQERHDNTQTVRLATLRKAEACIAELERTSQYWKDEHLAGNKRIAELVSQRATQDTAVKTLEGEKRYQGAQLEGIEKIIDRLETLPQETLYSRGIAYELRSALQQEAGK
jgi:hypothetical protein